MGKKMNVHGFEEFAGQSTAHLVPGTISETDMLSLICY